jgi:hypothetical protein
MQEDAAQDRISASDYQSWIKTVASTPDLNGGGDILAPIFRKILEGRHFNTVFEWCAGPAWIGLWLLETGICDELVTGDVNERSVEMVEKTAKKHNYKVRSYLSDNLESIPEWERFNLVVSNPPNYCNIQKAHPLGFLRDDLRPSDIGWKIHDNFYSSIRPYLLEDSLMYISEVSPYDEEVYFGGKLYDSRAEPPIKEFVEMTERNGLRIGKAIPYDFKESGGLDCRMLEIEPTH